MRLFLLDLRTVLFEATIAVLNGCLSRNCCPALGNYFGGNNYDIAYHIFTVEKRIKRARALWWMELNGFEMCCRLTG